MNREAIIERVAQKRWDKITSDTNKRVGYKVSKMWNELPQREKVSKGAHIEEIFDSAGRTPGQGGEAGGTGLQGWEVGEE